MWVDETHGFKYFDDRDLVGFIDGTKNPVGEAYVEVAIIGDEDAAFAGGSYVIVQTGGALRAGRTLGFCR